VTVRTGIALALVLALTACGPRPIGDFGRAAPSYHHDVAMPAYGQRLAAERGEPVSDFNQTDQERLMHDRVWRFLISAHAKDWVSDFATELQRTRLRPINTGRFATDRYYTWIKQTEYRSSPVRFDTMTRHIQADLDTLPGTFAAICAVRVVDANRAEALSRLPSLDAEAAANVEARKAENEMSIFWFAEMLAYRHASYALALDNLLVETPHPQSVTTDAALTDLERFVTLARQDQFCGQGGASGMVAGTTIPSRYATMQPGADLPRK
jgi:hypothetical protein